MGGVEITDFSAPDEVRNPDGTTVEVVKLGSVEVGRYTFQPGWRWSECVKPVAGTDSCQVHHIGVVLAGRLHIEHEDGTVVEIDPGTVYDISPGHDSSVLGDEAFVAVEFQGATTFAR